MVKRTPNSGFFIKPFWQENCFICERVLESEGIMKKNLILIMLTVTLGILLQGCYTQLATSYDDDESYAEKQNRSSSSSYSWYDTYPSYSYWGFQYYYPSWHSYWYYERWYWWYEPWYAPVVVVYPAPYWYYRYYYSPYWHTHNWGWYEGRVGGGSVRTTSAPRTWGSQRPAEGGYRDFGGSRNENMGGSITVPPAGRTGGTTTRGSVVPDGNSSRRTPESVTSPRGVSTGRSETPALRRSDGSRGERSDGTQNERVRESYTAPRDDSSRRTESSEERTPPSRTRTAESSQTSSPRETPQRSVERPSAPPPSRPAAPPPARNYGGESRGSENTARGRSTR